jgi:hypothetical protein
VRGRLEPGPIKTAAGRSDLPLLPLAIEIVKLRMQAQDADRRELGRAWQDTGLIFTTRTGRPVEPRNSSGPSTASGPRTYYGQLPYIICATRPQRC